MEHLENQNEYLKFRKLSLTRGLSEQAEIMRDNPPGKGYIFGKSSKGNKVLVEVKSAGPDGKESSEKFNFLMDATFVATLEPNIRLALKKVMTSVLDLFPQVSGVGYRVWVEDTTVDVLSQVMNEVRDGKLSEEFGKPPSNEDIIRSVRLSNHLDIFKEFFIEQ